MLADGKTPRAAVTEVTLVTGPGTRPGYNDQATLTKVYDAAKDPEAGTLEVKRRTDKSAGNATITLGPNATDADRLHELGHTAQALADPTAYETQAQDAATAGKGGPGPYNRSSSERYADSWAKNAKKKDPTRPPA
jgi:hypothetical protein